METRGDVIIWSLWGRQTDAIIDVELGDTDMNTYRSETVQKLLYWWEKIKKVKPGKHCHNKRTRFYLFVLSVDGTSSS